MNRVRDRETLLEAVFALLLALLFAYSIFAARQWPFNAALFPILIGVAGFVLAIVVSLVVWLGKGSGRHTSGKGPGVQGDLYLEEALLSGQTLRRTFIIFAWLLGLVPGVWLLGQKVALPLFMLLYLKTAGEKWWLSLLLTLATVVFLLGIFDQVIHVSWHDGMLFYWLGLEPL